MRATAIRGAFAAVIALLFVATAAATAQAFLIESIDPVDIQGDQEVGSEQTTDRGGGHMGGGGGHSFGGSMGGGGHSVGRPTGGGSHSVSRSTGSVQQYHKSGSKAHQGTGKLSKTPGEINEKSGKSPSTTASKINQQSGKSKNVTTSHVKKDITKLKNEISKLNKDKSKDKANLAKKSGQNPSKTALAKTSATGKSNVRPRTYDAKQDANNALGGCRT